MLSLAHLLEVAVFFALVRTNNLEFLVDDELAGGCCVGALFLTLNVRPLASPPGGNCRLVGDVRSKLLVADAVLRTCIIVSYKQRI